MKKLSLLALSASLAFGSIAPVLPSITAPISAEIRDYYQYWQGKKPSDRKKPSDISKISQQNTFNQLVADAGSTHTLELTEDLYYTIKGRNELENSITLKSKDNQPHTVVLYFDLTDTIVRGARLSEPVFIVEDNITLAMAYRRDILAVENVTSVIQESAGFEGSSQPMISVRGGELTLSNSYLQASKSGVVEMQRGTLNIVNGGMIASKCTKTNRPAITVGKGYQSPAEGEVTINLAKSSGSNSYYNSSVAVASGAVFGSGEGNPAISITPKANADNREESFPVIIKGDPDITQQSTYSNIIDGNGYDYAIVNRKTDLAAIDLQNLRIRNTGAGGLDLNASQVKCKNLEIYCDSLNEAKELPAVNISNGVDLTLEDCDISTNHNGVQTHTDAKVSIGANTHITAQNIGIVLNGSRGSLIVGIPGTYPDEDSFKNIRIYGKNAAILDTDLEPITINSGIFISNPDQPKIQIKKGGTEYLPGTIVYYVSNTSGGNPIIANGGVFINKNTDGKAIVYDNSSHENGYMSAERYLRVTSSEVFVSTPVLPGNLETFNNLNAQVKGPGTSSLSSESNQVFEDNEGIDWSSLYCYLNADDILQQMIDLNSTDGIDKDHPATIQFASSSNSWFDATKPLILNANLPEGTANLVWNFMIGSSDDQSIILPILSKDKGIESEYADRTNVWSNNSDGTDSYTSLVLDSNVTESKPAEEYAIWSIQPESVTITVQTEPIREGELFYLKAQVEPAGANQTVVWTFDSGDMVEILDGNEGKFMALKSGTVSVTATSITDLNIKSTPPVTLNIETAQIKPESIQITGPTTPVTIGDIFQLTANVSPENAPETVTWSTTTKDLVKINPQTGLCQALSNGSAEVSATSTVDSSIIGSKTIIIEKIPESLPVAPNNITVISNNSAPKVGEIFTVRAEVTPDYADQSVAWSTDTPSLVEIDKDTGECKALAAGKAKIIATSEVGENISGSLEIEIKAVPNGITITSSNPAPKVGDTFTVTAEVSPNDINQSVFWSTSTPDIVSIDPTTGECKALAAGKAEIIATSAVDEYVSGFFEIDIQANQSKPVTPSTPSQPSQPSEPETPAVINPPNDDPISDTGSYDLDFIPNSGTNAGIGHTGKGFTETGSQTLEDVNGYIVTFTQNENGTKAASVQNEEKITSSIITIPPESISNKEVSVSLGTNDTGKELVLAGNEMSEDFAPQLTINIPVESGEVNLTLPIEADTLDEGTIAMILDEDGTLTPIIKTSIDTDNNSIKIPLSGSAKIVILNNAVPFTDEIGTPVYARKAAAYVSARRLMTGMGEEFPKPFNFDSNITRGQFATILYRLEGEPSVEGAYPDGVIPGVWNADAARWAVMHGYMAQGGSSFNPQQDIKRDDLITVLYRLNNSPAANLSLLDKYQDAALLPNDEFKKAMAWGIENAIIGQGVNKLEPEDSASRAEIAAMFQRVIENLY